MRPYGAVVNNKDVCFRRNGDFTQSLDCHGEDIDPHYFLTGSGSPGELELRVKIETDSDSTSSGRFRLIPFSEDGFSHFTGSQVAFPDERRVVFRSAVRFCFLLNFTATPRSINAQPRPDTDGRRLVVPHSHSPQNFWILLSGI